MTSESPIPVDIRRQSNVMWTVWTAAAVRSRVFLHSLLCAAALNRYIGGRGSYYSVTYHKSKAIEEINASLSDPTLGLTDEIIASVFTLLCVELSRGITGHQDETGDVLD